jgi:hypothetical protein
MKRSTVSAYGARGFQQREPGLGGRSGGEHSVSVAEAEDRRTHQVQLHPPKPVRQLRALTRSRVQLIHATRDCVTGYDPVQHPLPFGG